jgi:hypothetical protein
MTFAGVYNRFFKSRISEKSMEKKSEPHYLAHPSDGKGRRIGWIPVQVPWAADSVFMDPGLADAVRRLLREGHTTEAQTLVDWFEEKESENAIES